MGNEITAGGIGEVVDQRSVRRLAPVQIGKAIVFVEQFGAPPELDLGDEIHPGPESRSRFLS